MGLFDSLPASKLSNIEKSCGTQSVISQTSHPNILLQGDQGNELIDLFVDESKLLQDVTVNRVNNCHGKVHYLDYCEIATQGAVGTDCPPSSMPTDYSRDWSVQKYRANFWVDSDILECNVERGALFSKIQGMFSRKMRSELELAAIQGDESLSVGPSQTRINNLLGVNDGWDKIMETCVPSCQVIDAQGKAPSKYLYYQIQEKLPNRYHMAAGDYRFVGPRQMATRWGLDVTNRETTMGDGALVGGAPGNPLGVPFYWVPQWRFYDYNAQSGAYNIWYTPLSNLQMYILRDMTVEQKRWPEYDATAVYVHYRVDFEVANPDMVVLVQNVLNCGTPFSEADCTGACPPC